MELSNSTRKESYWKKKKLNVLDYKDSKLRLLILKIPCFSSSVQSQKNNGVILFTEEVTEFTEELNYFPQVNFSPVIKFESDKPNNVWTVWNQGVNIGPVILTWAVASSPAQTSHLELKLLLGKRHSCAERACKLGITVDLAHDTSRIMLYLLNKSSEITVKIQHVFSWHLIFISSDLH